MLVITAMLSIPLLFGAFLIVYGVWLKQGKISQFHTRVMGLAWLCNFILIELYCQFSSQVSLISIDFLTYQLIDFVFACLLVSSGTFLGAFAWLGLLKVYPKIFHQFKSLNIITILAFSILSFALYFWIMQDMD